MRIIIKQDYDAMCYWTACYIKNIIIKHNAEDPRKQFILGLPTGSTPIGVYNYLIKFYKMNEISFNNVITFNMDEYIGLEPDHPQSYNYFMWDTFFNHIDIKKENVNILQGKHENMNQQCQDYENKIKNLGGIDLMLGGLGEDAHIAFNEPGSSLTSSTRLKTLNNNTINANSRFFKNHTDVPTMAITMGIDTIMQSKEVLIIVSGEKKAVALEKSIEGSINHNFPASMLQMHKKCCFIVDDDATNELKVKSVKYFKGLQQHIDCMGNPIHNNILSKIKETDKILIFSPHPDDDVIGMGSFLYNYPFKHNIYIAYMTSGENGVDGNNKLVRETEALSSLKSLSYDNPNLTFLRLPFYHNKNILDYDWSVDSTILEHFINDKNPDHIFICTDSDPNGTHLKCFNIIKNIRTMENNRLFWAYQGAWGKIPYTENTFFFPYKYESLERKMLSIKLHMSQYPAKFPGNDNTAFHDRVKINNKSDIFPGEYEERYFLIDNINKYIM